jgi:hypothetical protein
MNSAELSIRILLQDQLGIKLPVPKPPEYIAPQGSMDHVAEILASHDHPFILVGRSTPRWMGYEGMIDSVCDILIRNSVLVNVASNLVETGHWRFHDPGPYTHLDPDAYTECEADLVLQRIDMRDDKEYQYLCLWSETTYHISVDDCPLVEVPDVYPWHGILVEEKWHPAIDRENGWWFGPRLHPDTSVSNLPERATQKIIFSKELPRGLSPSKNYQVFVPRIPAYLDAMIYHATRYEQSKPALASNAHWQIQNLTRCLYLELPHQQLPLLIELEGYEYMENYLQRFVRKPRFVYRTAPGTEFEATRVKEWDPTSFPDWCNTKDSLGPAMRSAHQETSQRLESE